MSNDALCVPSRDVSSRLVCTLIRVLPLNWGYARTGDGKEAIATSKRDRREGRTARRESDAGQERKNERGCAHLLPVLISRLAARNECISGLRGSNGFASREKPKTPSAYAKGRAR